MNALKNNSRFGLFPLEQFAREMDRWFEHPQWSEEGTYPMVYTPASVWEDDTHYYIELDVPGIPKDAFDIKVVENQLFVSAERKAPEEERHFIRNERPFGRFQRSFKLTSKIDDSSVEADLDNGVLRISMLKAPESRVRKIEIKSCDSK